MTRRRPVSVLVDLCRCVSWYAIEAPILSRMVYKRVKDWTFGLSPSVKLCFLYIFMVVNTSIRVWKVFQKWYFIGVAKVTYVQRLRVIVNSIKITRFGFVFGKISRGFVFVSLVSFSIIYLCAICGCYYFQKLMFAATPLRNLLLNKVHW